jgi:hypothetical protein
MNDKIIFIKLIKKWTSLHTLFTNLFTYLLYDVYIFSKYCQFANDYLKYFRMQIKSKTSPVDVCFIALCHLRMILDEQYCIILEHKNFYYSTMKFHSIQISYLALHLSICYSTQLRVSGLLSLSYIKRIISIFNINSYILSL